MVQVNGGDEITPDDQMSDYIDPGNFVTMQWRNVACWRPSLSGETSPPLQIFVSLKKKKGRVLFCAPLKLFAPL